MKVEGFALRLRPRSAWESADLGVRLAQHTAASVYPSLLLALVPILLLTSACYQYSSVLATLFLWWSKPWLDRSILFVLARAAFDQPTHPRDLWQSRREIWWRQLWYSWSLRRLSPWRSFTQPVYQLEGLVGPARRERLSQLRRGHSGTAALVTSAFATIEEVLTLSLLFLWVWLIPRPTPYDWSLQGLTAFDSQLPGWSGLVCYALIVLVLEPLYVGAGFAMYLNRRVELEAWDIEQEFRRAFDR